MANIIKIKNSAVAGKTPTDADLVEGELALNTADSVLWTKNSDGVIKQVGKQVSADFVHDSLQGFVEEEHIDWTVTNVAKIHSSNLPNVAKTSVQTAANQLDMLGLATEEGDVVVRTDQSKTYVRNEGLVGDMTGFTELLAEGVTYDPTTLQAEVNVNTAKVGITVAQGNAIATNTDKVGITPEQATAITANSLKVSNVEHPVVPEGALFTDTVYSSTLIDAAVALNTAKVSNVAHPIVPEGAVFTDTDTVYTHPANHAISVITGLQTALDSKVTEDASSTTLVAATTTVIFSMSLSTYRSAKLMITAKQGTKYETLELTVLHDGTNSFHNEFGVVYSDVDFVTLTTDVSGGNVRVLALTAAVSTIKVNARKQPV